MYKNSNTKTLWSKKVERCIYKIYDKETKVVKKILKKLFDGPCGISISMCILILGLGIGISLIGKQHPILAQNIVIAISIIFGQYLLISFVEEKIEQKRLKNMTTFDLLKKYVEYIDVVLDCIDESGNKNFLYNSEKWINNFDSCIYVLSKKVKKRKFNDFDVSACLVTALMTSGEKTRENAIFAFKCVKKIIAKPKFYIRHVNLANEITLEAAGKYEEVNTSLINENDIYTKMCINRILSIAYNFDVEDLTALSDLFSNFYEMLP